MSATPRPWSINREVVCLREASKKHPEWPRVMLFDKRIYSDFIEPLGLQICRGQGELDKLAISPDASLIVSAVNSHDAALNLAKSVLMLQVDAKGHKKIPQPVCQRAREVLRLAGEKA